MQKTLQPAIRITPETPLIDETIEIVVTGLAPKQRITLRLAESGVPGGKLEGSSHAVFEADEQGEVHLSRQKPLSGTYEEVDPMGLFWSVEIDQLQFARTLHLDEIQFAPTMATVRLDLEADGQLLARKEFSRRFISPDVEIKLVRDNNLAGKFFCKPGTVNKPAILVVGGSEGSLVSSSQWAALFASHGYPALALAYFQCENLPDDIRCIPLEYIRTAVQWLQDQEETDASKIVMFGRSKGAELSLVAGATFSEIKAVIASSPSSIVAIGSCGCSNGRDHDPQSSWSYQGKPLPFLEWSKDQCTEAIARIRNWERFDHIHRMGLQEEGRVEKATIPVEKINGPILLISSGDDHYWPSDLHCERIKARLARHSFPHPVIHLNYEDVGHGIRFPYIQTTRLRLNGGTAKNNAFASKDSYEHILRFLETISS